MYVLVWELPEVDSEQTRIQIQAIIWEVIPESWIIHTTKTWYYENM